MLDSKTTVAGLFTSYVKQLYTTDTTAIHILLLVI